MKKSGLAIAWMQRTPYGPVMTDDLSGKTVMVTGANTGIGFETVMHFATMNPARIIMGCRNETKGKAALARLEEQTGYVNAEMWLIDLANFSSISDFADKFEKDGGRLDICIANAGLGLTSYKQTTDGWEMMLGVNHLGTSMFSLLLYPRLLRTAEEHGTTSRLVVVSSDSHYGATVPEEALESPGILEKLNEKCDGYARYALTKLMNVFFSRSFADHIPESTPVIINSVNPGFCTSEFIRSENVGATIALVFSFLQRMLAHTSEEGARQLVWAALAGKGEEDRLRGAFIWQDGVMEASDYSLSPTGKEAQRRIWDETLEVLGKVTPAIGVISEQYLTKRS